MAKKYELYSNASGAFLALPFISHFVRDKFIDTAKSVPAAVKDLNDKFASLDKEASEAWFDSLGAGDYKKYKPEFDALRADANNLTKLYLSITNTPDINPNDMAKGISDYLANQNTPKDIMAELSQFETLMYSVSQKSGAARSHLDDVKNSLTKLIEVAEDFGLSAGMHNSVRQAQDAIDRLNTELTKIGPEIQKIKDEAEKKSQEAGKPGVAQSNPAQNIEDISKISV